MTIIALSYLAITVLTLTYQGFCYRQYKKAVCTVPGHAEQMNKSVVYA